MPPVKSSQPPPDSAQIFLTLRNKLLSLNPQEVDIKSTPQHPNVWGVLMEFVISGTVVTLAALVDGTSSLYFSSGGGIIGSGSHAVVGDAARHMIAIAEQCLDLTEPVTECPMPNPQWIRFHLLTFHGIYSRAVSEKDLVSGESGLFPLYSAGQALITQIRLVKESKTQA